MEIQLRRDVQLVGDIFPVLFALTHALGKQIFDLPVHRAEVILCPSGKMIVDGAVGMVEMALDRLNENKVVELDDERKAAMVSNLLVVQCGNRDAQPIVNSGSLY